MNLTIRQWRRAKELSQEELARRCNVHRNTYAAWEANPEKISISNARKIAYALGENVFTIFFNDRSTNSRF